MAPKFDCQSKLLGPSENEIVQKAESKLRPPATRACAALTGQLQYYSSTFNVR